MDNLILVISVLSAVAVIISVLPQIIFRNKTKNEQKLSFFLVFVSTILVTVSLVAYLKISNELTSESISRSTLKSSDIENISEYELNQRQQVLQEKLDFFEKSKRQESPSLTASSQKYNLNGTWHSEVGIVYRISQHGDNISIQEFNPTYGIIAVGSGFISGKKVHIQYHTAINTIGQGELIIGSDGNSMIGTFKNSKGYVTKAILFRGN